MVAGPTGISRSERAMVRKTKVMVMDRRLVLEKKSFSTWERTKPSVLPRIREKTISSRGLITMEITSRLPPSMALAIPKETEKTTRPTASSRATMGSRRLVRGPWALY